MNPAEKQLAHALIDRLPPEQMDAPLRFLEFLLLDPVARAVATVPADDEPVTEDDRRRIQTAETALARKEPGIPMEDVLAEFGLTVDDFPTREH